MRGKRYLLATVSSLAILGAVHIVAPANAADLPARMPVKAPVAAAPAFSWTGLYIGVHGGGAWLDHNQRTFITNGACNVLDFDATSDCDLDKSGMMFGGFAGYNIQAGQFVYGLEVDASWADLDRRKSYSAAAGLSSPITLHTEIGWLATVRARLGLAVNRTLIYVTGGAAFAGIDSGWFDSSTPRLGASVDETKFGWVIGGGIEHAFAGNWSLRVEALFHDFEKAKDSVTETGFTYSTKFRHQVTTVRGGIALRW